jgi:two-component system, OmpR family, KDP operon response regulator KdpE
MSKVKVLVVDDEQAIRRFLRIGLEAEGYDVVDAETGKAAIAMAATHVPELVILDLGLPDLDGAQVLAQLRQWSSVPEVQGPE